MPIRSLQPDLSLYTTAVPKGLAGMQHALKLCPMHSQSLLCFCSLQDALDLIEFASGPAESEWGSLRAKMGHPDPWQLNYFAIGNEVSCWP